MDEEVLDPDPIPYKLPADLDHISTPKVKSGSGRSTSRSRKLITKSQAPAWLENWNCESRPRSNGRLDKYYIHKETHVKCRSLKEVDRYEKEGILPGRKGKGKEKTITKQEFEEMGSNKKKKEQENMSTRKFQVNSEEPAGKMSIPQLLEDVQKQENMSVEKSLEDAQQPENVPVEKQLADVQGPKNTSVEKFMADSHESVQKFLAKMRRK